MTEAITAAGGRSGAEEILARILENAGQAGDRLLAAALQDKGFGIDGGDTDALLTQETAKLWDYLRGVTPDFSLYDAFLYRNDYHNAKAIL